MQEWQFFSVEVSGQHSSAVARGLKASIIIPTRNRAALLEACLESLTRQTLPSELFEVLIVDNGSTDETEAISRTFLDRLQLLYAFAPEPGLHVGRHEGLRRAGTNVLAFADDDVEAEPTWVQAIVEAFEDSSVALVGGNNYPMFQEPPPAWLERWWNRPAYRGGRALAYLSVLDLGTGRFEIDPGYVWGCNYAIRRDVLLRAGGFHPDGMPGDRLRYRGDGETHVSNFVRQAGLPAVFDSKASVRHRVPRDRMTSDYFCRRAYAQGISDSYAGLRDWHGRRSWRRAISRYVFEWLRRAHDLAERGLSHTDAVERELAAVRMAMRKAYRDGYAFHRRSVRTDPELRAWVLKESYL